MDKIENNDNKVNNKSFQTLSSESYDFSNNIQKSNEFLYFINSSIKYKFLNTFNKLKKFLKKSFSFPSKILNKFILILNIIGFILYFFSLIGCHKGEENLCVTDFFVQFYILAALLIIDCIIISITITLIIWKKIKIFHLIYIIIGYYIYYQYDNSYTLVKHGGYNIIFLILISMMLVLIYSFFIILITKFRKKKWKFIIFLIIFTIILPLLFHIYILSITSCEKFDLGYNNTRIINTDSDSCWFGKPKNCKMNFYYDKLDLSTQITPINYNTKQVFMDNLDKEKYKNVKRFGIPLLKHEKGDKSLFKGYNLNKFVDNNYIDMDKINITEVKYMPDIIINFDDKNIGHVEINVHRNESLIKERKKLENPNSLFKNVMLVFTDGVSRNNFMRVFKKLGKWIEKFMPPKKNYRTYQLLKYHTTGTYTQSNIQPMFYGRGMYSKQGIQFTKYYRENGYISAFSFGQCALELFPDRELIFISDTYFDGWDHYITGLFCNNNFFDIKLPLKKGVSSVFRRILFGRDSFEYVIEYGVKFWEIYSDVRKLLLIGFMDGHEATGAVIKYVDDYLYTNINNLYEKGLLKDTVILFFSDHGLHCSTVFPVLAPDNYFHERSLSYMFIFMDKKENFNDEQLLKNQQKFITAYDIYETLYHIVYGNNYIRQENPDMDKRFSIFEKINESNRTCSNYIEIIEGTCKCFPPKK